MESLWTTLAPFLGLQLYAAALVLLLALGYIIYRKHTPLLVLQQHGIRGPRPSFLLGNYWQIHQLGWLKFCDRLYEQYGPICGFYIGCQPCVLVADLEMLKQILVRQYESFLHRPIHIIKIVADCPRPMFVQEGEEWKRLRKKLSPLFSSMKIKMMAPVVKRACDSLVKRLGESASSKKSVNVLKLYGMFSMQAILSCGFGCEVDTQQGEADYLTDATCAWWNQMQDNQDVYFDGIEFVLSNFTFLKPLLRWLISKSPAGKSVFVLTQTVQSLVKAKKNRSKSGKFKDMLQILLDANIIDEDGIKPSENKLTEDEIVINALGLMFAASENPSNTLAFSSYLLALHPSVQDRLHSEIEEYFENNPDSTLYDATMEIQYLDMVINEVLRLYPPVPRQWRECLKTTEINGVTIPKGTVVHIPFYLLHHNPEYWPDPEKFDPERFTPEEKAKRPHLSFVPFSWGPLNCIGMRFGLLEVKAALIEILRKYKFVQAPDTEIPIQTNIGQHVTPKNGVYLNIVNCD